MIKKGLILLVEDNLKLLDANRRLLECEGYETLTAKNLSEARGRLKETTVDGIVLDIMLPDGSGLDFLKELRDASSNIPVLLLTALNTPEDVVRGLKSGGDDYMPKPINIEELVARVEALMRRAARVPETIVKGSLKLDIAAGQAFLDDKDMLLTQKEFSLLLLFVQNDGRAMSADYLYEKVWRHPMNEDNRALKKHLSNLRKKLEEEDCGYQIIATRGEGYCFEKT